jgi:hypothetical protein
MITMDEALGQQTLYNRPNQAQTFFARVTQDVVAGD